MSLSQSVALTFWRSHTIFFLDRTVLLPQPLLIAMSRSVTNVLRGSLSTAPGPGGAGSIGHYLQPCRKVVLSYCETSPASEGVRTWLKNSGASKLAKMWPQIEWVVKEGKKGSEPSVTAHYGEQKQTKHEAKMLPAPTSCFL